MKDTLIAFYLDWVNNHLTVEQMAENKGLTEVETTTLIELGKKYHEEHVDELKDSMFY